MTIANKAAARHEPPLIIEATRNEVSESRHLVDAVAVDATGAVMACWGDAERAIFPRSAIKCLQALPLVASGAADAFGLGDAHLALACASHSSEPAHVDTVRRWLARLDLTVADLECGAHWPRDPDMGRALAAAGGVPDNAFNNCSGKHAGMLTLARHRGWDHHGYVGIGHPVQQEIFTTISAIADVDLLKAPYGVDGCSAPNPVLPMKNIALAFARFAAAGANDGQAMAGLDAPLAAACGRLARATAAEPFMIAGSNRLCTAIVEASRGRILAKTGAEGVYTLAVPERRLGLVLKVRDGAARAANVAVIAIMESLELMDDGLRAALRDFLPEKLRNCRDIVTGEIRPVKSADITESEGKAES